jgi:hypothetical protein
MIEAMSSGLSNTRQPTSLCRVLERILLRPYPFTSNSFVPAAFPFKDTSTLYVPAGQPLGFAIWNSVAALPVGAMVWVDSFTSCPSW